MTKKLVLRIEDLFTIESLTANQSKFLDNYNNYDVHMLHGVAGTGKTFLAIYRAIEDVLNKGTPYKQVVLVRSAVSSRDIGALPGDEEEKSMVYQIPYIQVCKDLFNRRDAYERLKEQKALQFSLSSFMRGVTLDETILVLDEMQNLSYQELSTVITRIGVNSKILFCGDTRQTDLPTKKGIDKFMKVLDNMSCVHRVEFGIDDIVRSDIVKEFIITEDKLYGGN